MFVTWSEIMWSPFNKNDDSKPEATKIIKNQKSFLIGILLLTAGLISVSLTVNQGFQIVTEESDSENEQIEEFDISVYIFLALILGLGLVWMSFSIFDKEERKRIQNLTTDRPNSDLIKANDVYFVAADLIRDLTILSNILFAVGSVSLFTFLLIIQNFTLGAVITLFSIFLVISYFVLMVIVLYLRSKRIRIELLAQPMEDAISEL